MTKKLEARLYKYVSRKIHVTDAIIETEYFTERYILRRILDKFLFIVWSKLHPPTNEKFGIEVQDTSCHVLIIITRFPLSLASHSYLGIHHHSQSSRIKRDRLFEDLAVGVLVLLAVDNDRAVPSPLSLNELTVLRLGGVKLGERVALVVRSDIEDREVLLATDDESTLDDGVVVLSVNGSRSEDVLAGGFQAGVEATDEVVGHESQSKLIVVLVVNAPDGVVLEGNSSPEVAEGFLLIVVGEVALEVIKSVSGLGEKVARVLGLGGSGSGLFLSSGGRGGLSSLSGLGSLGLLGGDVGQGRLVKVLKLGGNGGVDGLVDNGVEPTGDVGELLAPLRAEEVLETTGGDSSGEEISEGDAVTNEVGVAEEVVLDNLEGLESLLGGIINGLLVIWVTADKRAEPAAQRAKDLVVEVGQPSENGGIAEGGAVSISLAKRGLSDP